MNTYKVSLEIYVEAKDHRDAIEEFRKWQEEHVCNYFSEHVTEETPRSFEWVED